MISAKIPSGPTSVRGKAVAATNALREGVFSKQLYIGGEDRQLHDRMYSELLAQFKPVTPMQFVAFEAIPGNAWRHILALRREARQFECNLTSNDSDPAIEPPQSGSIVQWYAANSNSSRAAINLLMLAKSQLNECGRVHHLLLEELAKAFGPEFVAQLEQWNTSDMTALRHIHSTREKVKLWGIASPETAEPMVKVITDPTERVHMQATLIDMKVENVSDMRHVLQHGDDLSRRASAGHTEPAHRYVSSTYRSLTKSVEFYLDILEQGL